MWSLIAVLFPGFAMGALLSLGSTLTTENEIPVLWDPAGWPLELWILASGGVFGTLAGILDWRFHRYGGRRIPKAERQAELCALGLGVPLFVLLVVASGTGNPELLLIPIVLVSLSMVALIVYDETRFHRRCTPYETALHRVLVGGNGIAFLAWLHWCFNSGPQLA